MMSHDLEVAQQIAMKSAKDAAGISFSRNSEKIRKRKRERVSERETGFFTPTNFGHSRQTGAKTHRNVLSGIGMVADLLPILA
jgi:hypothetical protein